MGRQEGEEREIVNVSGLDDRVTEAKTDIDYNKVYVYKCEECGETVESYRRDLMVDHPISEHSSDKRGKFMLETERLVEEE